MPMPTRSHDKLCPMEKTDWQYPYACCCDVIFNTRIDMLNVMLNECQHEEFTCQNCIDKTRSVASVYGIKES
jgi:hypothetical protein